MTGIDDFRTGQRKLRPAMAVRGAGAAGDVESGDLVNLCSAEAAAVGLPCPVAVLVSKREVTPGAEGEFVFGDDLPTAIDQVLLGLEVDGRR